MRLGPDIGSCVIRREDYGELLKLFDSIETKAKRMQNALKPVLECDCWIERFNGGSIIMDGMEKAIDAITEAKRIYKGVVK